MWELRILGAGDLRQVGQGDFATVHLQPKRFALLSYLALATSRGGCGRDSLLPLFWPEVGERQARNALNQAVHGLRHSLGSAIVRSLGTDRLTLSRELFWCDAVAFEEVRTSGNHDRALELYQGDLLPGLHVPGAPEFDFWLEGVRHRLRRLAAESARQLTQEAVTAESLFTASRWLARLIEIEPTDEDALRWWMRLMERAGDRPGALRAFRQFEDRLRHELDLEPGPETISLVKSIRSRDAPALRDRPPAKGGVSIAVLPFVDWSGDPGRAYLCDGITGAVAGAIGEVPGLEVTAPSSVSGVGDRLRNLREVADRLWVSHVLEGRVQRRRDRVHVRIDLLQLPEGLRVFSREYARSVEDLFSVHAEVAKDVAVELRGVSAESERSLPSPACNSEAYDQYLRGRFLLNKRNPVDLGKAVSLLEDASRGAPEFAPAFASLGEAHAIRGAVFQDLLPSRTSIPLAIAAQEEALRIDPGQAEAHASVGVLQALYGWDWEGALEALERACLLAPRSGKVHLCRATVLLYGGRLQEALEAITTAIGLDPFVLAYREVCGTCLYLQGRYALALTTIRETLEMDPNLYVSAVTLGDTLAALSQTEEAFAAYDRAITKVGRRPYVLTALACLHARLGQTGEAEEILEALSRPFEGSYVRPTYLGQVNAALGDRDGAISCLQTACQERDIHVASINVDPRFDPLRSDPRFFSLLRMVGSIHPRSGHRVPPS